MRKIKVHAEYLKIKDTKREKRYKQIFKELDDWELYNNHQLAKLNENGIQQDKEGWN